MACKVLLGKTNERDKEINVTAPVTVEFNLSKSFQSYSYYQKHVERKGCISIHQYSEIESFVKSCMYRYLVYGFILFEACIKKI